MRAIYAISMVIRNGGLNLQVQVMFRLKSHVTAELNEMVQLSKYRTFVNIAEASASESATVGVQLGRGHHSRPQGTR